MCGSASPFSSVRKLAGRVVRASCSHFALYAFSGYCGGCLGGRRHGSRDVRHSEEASAWNFRTVRIIGNAALL